jgi:hypothetical protein
MIAGNKWLVMLCKSVTRPLTFTEEVVILYLLWDTQTYEHQPLIVLIKSERLCKGWYDVFDSDHVLMRKFSLFLTILLLFK